ncbi:unnamed protein product [Pedinophyceae sp. YPF-701]|nr:unnamed protein product [Pedinophyceae sp. YPF-701]
MERCGRRACVRAPGRSTAAVRLGAGALDCVRRIAVLQRRRSCAGTPCECVRRDPGTHNPSEECYSVSQLRREPRSAASGRGGARVRQFPDLRGASCGCITSVAAMPSLSGHAQAAPPLKGAAATADLRATHIICTMGPRNATEENLRKLLDAGMDVMRLNFSHGDYEWFEQTINLVRRIQAEPGSTARLCAIALDTKGPEIRTGFMAEGPSKGGKEILIKQGSTVEVHTGDDWKQKGDANNLYVDYKDLCTTVSPGSIIFVSDGQLELRVTEVKADSVVTRAVNSLAIGDRKGVNLPGAIVTLPAVSEKDRQDLAFGARMGVDFVFASFIRSGEQVREVRKALGPEGADIKVIAKIENQEGLDNFDQILEEADGVMVARGDLGIEIPAPQVFAAQKQLIRRCNAEGKPVICATQMLESMITNPRPTRAEVTDVGQAVLDGADCVMLSGETAKGDWPIEACSTMAAICRQAERLFPSYQVYKDLQALNRHRESMHFCEATACSAVGMVHELHAKAMVVMPRSGRTARFISKYRAPVPVVCATSSERMARHMLLHRGMLPLVVDAALLTEDMSTRNTHCLISLATETLRTYGVVNPGDTIICVHSERVDNADLWCKTLSAVPREFKPIKKVWGSELDFSRLDPASSSGHVPGQRTEPKDHLTPLSQVIRTMAERQVEQVQKTSSGKDKSRMLTKFHTLRELDPSEAVQTQLVLRVVNVPAGV